MAVSAAGLTSEIIAKMDSKGFDIDNEKTNGEARKYIEALSEAIIAHITANAEVDDKGGTSAALWKII